MKTTLTTATSIKNLTQDDKTNACKWYINYTGASAGDAFKGVIKSIICTYRSCRMTKIYL